tara:strand:- start:228 stop:491 length:264 start_codon:yes stop_codon:yes gene_type:complete
LTKDDFSEKLEEKLRQTQEFKDNSSKNGYSIGLKISMDFLSSIIAGVLIGLGIDKVFSTKPVFFIIFLLLGIVSGFYNLYKTVKKIN